MRLGAHMPTGGGVWKALQCGGEIGCEIVQIFAGLDEVFAATRSSPVRIALENTAGQGTCLGYRTAHLADIFDQAKTPERLGACLDTAHFFAAGYDIRTPKGWNAAIKEVQSLIGLKQIMAFHLNDSKTDLTTTRGAAPMSGSDAPCARPVTGSVPSPSGCYGFHEGQSYEVPTKAPDFRVRSKPGPAPAWRALPA